MRPPTSSVFWRTLFSRLDPLDALSLVHTSPDAISLFHEHGWRSADASLRVLHDLYCGECASPYEQRILSARSPQILRVVYALSPRPAHDTRTYTPGVTYSDACRFPVVAHVTTSPLVAVPWALSIVRFMDEYDREYSNALIELLDKLDAAETLSGAFALISAGVFKSLEDVDAFVKRGRKRGVSPVSDFIAQRPLKEIFLFEIEQLTNTNKWGLFEGYIRQKKFDFNLRDCFVPNTLAMEGQTFLLGLLLKNTRLRFSDGGAALVRLATDSDNLETLKTVLAYPFIVDSAAFNGALWIAVQRNKSVCLKLLLADPRVDISETGPVLLEDATRRSFLSGAQALVRAGVDPYPVMSDLFNVTAEMSDYTFSAELEKRFPPGKQRREARQARSEALLYAVFGSDNWYIKEIMATRICERHNFPDGSIGVILHRILGDASVYVEYIATENSGKGYGRRMMNVFIEKHRRKTILLESVKVPHVLKFYRSLGFHQSTKGLKGANKLPLFLRDQDVSQDPRTRPKPAIKPREQKDYKHMPFKKMVETLEQ